VSSSLARWGPPAPPRSWPRGARTGSQACALSCPVPGPRDYLTSGEVRSFALLFTLPADTAAGTYVARVHGDMNAGTVTAPADLTPQNNTVAFTLTVPAA